MANNIYKDNSTNQSSDQGGPTSISNCPDIAFIDRSRESRQTVAGFRGGPFHTHCR